jgi:protein CpxP
MNQSGRNRVLLTIIAVLLITNLAMLFLFFRMNKADEHKKSPGFSERLKTDVGFTSGQFEVYDVKRKAFWTKMRQRFDDIKTTKQNFYHYLYDPNVPDSVLQKHADEIGNQQKDLDLFVIRHFKDVRTMCTKEQLPKYDSLMPLIIDRMTARPQKKK